MKAHPAHRTAPPALADKNLPAPSPAAIPPALAGFDSYPNSAYVRLPVVRVLFGISTATAWRWVKKGTLPAGRKLSDGVTAWNVGELRKALSGEAWQ